MIYVWLYILSISWGAVGLMIILCLAFIILEEIEGRFYYPSKEDILIP